jgi:hypothetical protein
VIQSTSEKEDNLKNLVVKLLQERNLSDFEMLDSLFTEVKRELQNQQTPSLGILFMPRIRHKFSLTRDLLNFHI